MSYPPQQSIPAGWYPDPSPQNPGGTRWWDGARWTEHSRPGAAAVPVPPVQPAPPVQQAPVQAAPVQQTPVPPAQQPTYPPQMPAQQQAPQQQATPAYGAMAGYGATYPVPATTGYPRVAPGTSALTTWIWLVIGLPLVTIIVETIILPSALVNYFTAILKAGTSTQGGQLGSEMTPQVTSAVAQYLVTVAIVWVIGLVIYGLCVLFAFFDARELARRGVVRPFHWAWAFLGIVYIIGRIVVTHRRGATRSLWPLWALIAVFVVAIALNIVTSTVIFNGVANDIGQINGFYSGS